MQLASSMPLGKWAPVKWAPVLPLLLGELVIIRPQTPELRCSPLNAKAIGTQRGAYDYRVESRRCCCSGGVAELIFPALFGVVGLREMFLPVDIAALW